MAVFNLGSATETEDARTLGNAFAELKGLEGNCFDGKQWPRFIMTDDSQTLRMALRRTYPRSRNPRRLSARIKIETPRTQAADCAEFDTFRLRVRVISGDTLAGAPFRIS